VPLFDNPSLIGHLTELRKRLLWSIIVIFVLSLISYHYAEHIINVLIYPFQKVAQGTKHPHHFIYTGLPEVFLVQVKVAFWCGLITALPMILMQIWQFIAPGLYTNEKRFFLIILWSTPLLFAIGLLSAYYIVIPNAWRFFLSFEQSATPHIMSILLEARISEYLNLTIQFLVIFGLSFQLPIALIILAKIGILNYVTLKNSRRYVFIMILIAAAILTPPDVLSMIALAVPLYLLYEITLIILRLMPNIER